MTEETETRPSLNKTHKFKCKEWAKEYLKTDYLKVLWTDEMRVTLDGPDGWTVVGSGTEELHFNSDASKVIPGNGACSDRGNSVGLEVSPLLTSSQVGGSVAEDEVDATVKDETNLQRVKRELNEVMVWKLKMWMVILIVLLLIALIFTVTFIVCAAGSDDVDEKYDRSSFVVERFFKGNFTLANNSITSHPATQPDDSEKLLEILKQQLTAVYNSSPALARYFSDVTINNFRDDTAQFELQFIIPSENEQLVRYTLSRDMVKSVLLQHFYDQDQDAGDYPYVIPASLNMEVWTKRRI